MEMHYPELYYRVYPKVRQCVSKYYPSYMPIYEMPENEELESMVDEVYEEMIKECPEIDNDPKERRRGSSRKTSSQQRPFYGRRRLFRDLAGILLLRELLRRRYPRYYRPGYGYGPGYGYYGPGYGY